MTEHSERERGVILSLLKRLVDQRLPRLLEMQQRVERGELLSKTDLAYLDKALEEANANRRHVAHFPEYSDIVVKLVQLYGDITTKALENEQARK